MLIVLNLIEWLAVQRESGVRFSQLGCTSLETCMLFACVFSHSSPRTL